MSADTPVPPREERLRDMEFNGSSVLCDDNDPVFLSLPEPVNGMRHFYQACCDCGLVHEVRFTGDKVQFIRAALEQARQIREKALADNPTLFHLAAERTTQDAEIAALKVKLELEREMRRETETVVAPHRCPICNGTGLVSVPLGVAGDLPSFTSASAGPWPCRPCNGSGLIWGTRETEK